MTVTTVTDRAVFISAQPIPITRPLRDRAVSYWYPVDTGPDLWGSVPDPHREPDEAIRLDWPNTESTGTDWLSVNWSGIVSAVSAGKGGDRIGPWLSDLALRLCKEGLNELPASQADDDHTAIMEEIVSIASQLWGIRCRYGIDPSECISRRETDLGTVSVDPIDLDSLFSVDPEYSEPIERLREARRNDTSRIVDRLLSTCRIDTRPAPRSMAAEVLARYRPVAELMVDMPDASDADRAEELGISRQSFQRRRSDLEKRGFFGLMLDHLVDWESLFAEG